MMQLAASLVRAPARTAFERSENAAAPLADARSGFSLTLEQKKLREAAQAFEAVFLREMIGSMRKARLADDLFGSGATDNFREMADADTATRMAKLGAFGIAGLVEKQLGGAT